MKKLFIIIFILSLTKNLSSQTASWTSSRPTIVSVNSSGVAKLETTNTGGEQFVTIMSTTSQNGKIITSTKQIEVNPYYPGCNEPSVYVAGVWWAACNVGASTSTAYGNIYTWGQAQIACANSWSLPSVQNYIDLNCASGIGCDTGVDVRNYGNFRATKNGVVGMYFSDLFFPAGGNNSYSDSGNCGVYWSSTATGRSMHFRFNEPLQFVIPNYNYSSYHNTLNTIRCVKS